MAEWINTHLNPNNLFRAFAPNRTWFEDHKDRIAEWWGQGISADPARPPAPGSVVYYRRNKGQGGSALGRVVEQIKAVFEQFDMQSSALLSPTIGENAFSPVRLITNDIKHLDGVQQPWFFDSSKLPGAEAVDLSRNKRVASTIHKFKGRERDAIVLVGLDDFAEIRERVDPRNVFSMFYVGATRARQHLLIIQWSDSAYATHQSRSEEPVVDNPFEKPFIQVERMLQFCPYNKLLCEESDECLQSRMIGTVPGISLVRDDYLVSGAHTPRRLRTVERVLEIIGTGVNIRLQLLLDDGVLQVPSEEEDTQMPIDLSFFLMRLRNEAKNRTEEYSWGEVLEIATAFLTVQDQRYSRWRQVRDFSRWPVVRQSGKLDEMVRNLVRLLNMAAAHKGEEGISTEDAARMSRNAIGGVAYDRMVERLKRMRREKMIEFHLCLKFDMQKNSTFVRLHSSNLVGVTAIMLLSERVAERFWQLRESDVKSGAEWNGDGMTFVEVSISNRKEHDDLLEVGCLGAMQRERNLEALVHSSEVKMAKLFVAYPHVGELIGVKLHMNSFEFLHRLGFRKINRPFDAAVLGGVQHEAGEPVPGLV